LLYELFDDLDVGREKYKDTAKISSIRAGGIAKLIVYPNSADALVSVIRICIRNAIKYVLIGNCTNVAFADGIFDGVIISTLRLNKFSKDPGKAVLQAGVSLPYVIRALSNDGIYLPAELSGIPGSIGGALKNNAGAYGVSISDVFSEGVFYSADEDRFIKLSSKDMAFGYRCSILQAKKLYLLEATVLTSSCDSASQSGEIARFSKKRRDTQPSAPSLGSFFKRSYDVSAGKLIDLAGLKGFSIGGAKVSDKHAGFIINTANATVSDIEAVAEECRCRVFEKFGITLIREAEIIYNN
jgi:UDP-N-acetylmuramate dehydrogenase